MVCIRHVISRLFALLHEPINPGKMIKTFSLTQIILPRFIDQTEQKQNVQSPAKCQQIQTFFAVNVFYGGCNTRHQSVEHEDYFDLVGSRSIKWGRDRKNNKKNIGSFGLQRQKKVVVFPMLKTKSCLQIFRCLLISPFGFGQLQGSFNAAFLRNWNQGIFNFWAQNDLQKF